MQVNFSDFKLCYIAGKVAYFSSLPAENVHGDDWDDVPYEHNAGLPYGPTVFHTVTGEKLCQRDWNPDGTPKFQLFHVFFEDSPDSDFQEPCSGHTNSPHSVQTINKGIVPWLTARKWDSSLKDYKTVATLYANATYKAFEQFILSNGGMVYVPCTGITPYPEPKPNLPFHG